MFSQQRNFMAFKRTFNNFSPYPSTPIELSIPGDFRTSELCPNLLPKCHFLLHSSTGRGSNQANNKGKHFWASPGANKAVAASSQTECSAHGKLMGLCRGQRSLWMPSQACPLQVTQGLWPLIKKNSPPVGVIC